MNQQMDAFFSLAMSAVQYPTLKEGLSFCYMLLETKRKKKKAFASFKKLHIISPTSAVFLLTVLYFSFRCQRKISELERRGIFWPFEVATSK